MRQRRSITSRFQSDAEESLLNLTPLIDVVFVVLIIFILIAPMLEIDKIQLANSFGKDSKKTETPNASPITIYVREDNSIWIHSKQVSLKELTSLLTVEKQKHPHRIPQLFHDNKASFGTYQNIKNAVEKVGFDQLEIILQPGQ